MSIVFPKKGFSSSEPMDVDEINRNLSTFVQEIQGSLGEHNWAEGAFTAATDISDGAVLRFYRTHQRVDWTHPSYPIKSRLENSGSITPSMPSTGYKVPNDHIWHTVGDDGSSEISVDVDSGNSILWVNFSYQVDFQASDVPNSRTHSRGSGIALPGLQVGIAIDDSIVSETITGALDTSNDLYGEGHHYRRDPASIDCVFPTPPGNRTVSAKVRLAHSRLKADERMDSSEDFYAIFNAVLFVVEMR